MRSHAKAVSLLRRRNRRSGGGVAPYNPDAHSQLVMRFDFADSTFSGTDFTSCVASNDPQYVMTDAGALPIQSATFGGRTCLNLGTSATAGSERRGVVLTAGTDWASEDFTAEDGMTIMAVIRPLGSFRDVIGTGSALAYSVRTSGSTYYISGGADSPSPSVPWSLPAPYILVFRQKFSTETMELSTGGADVYGSKTPVSTNRDFSTQTNFYIGGYSASSGGTFCEVAVFRGYLPTADVNEYGNYLADTWGAAWTDFGTASDVTYTGTPAVSFPGGETLIEYNTASSPTITVAKPTIVDTLLLGGGGSGGNGQFAGGCGGGGAGDMVPRKRILLGTGVYAATIGAGAVGITATATGNNGSASTFNGLTAIGGGGGGGENVPANNGGSGGGGGETSSSAAGLGTGENGNDGGPTGSTVPANVGSGGGGAGGVGLTGIGFSDAGNGGIGLQDSITGAAVYYCGGGGGSPFSANASNDLGAGGLGGGGGGNGSVPTSPDPGDLVVDGTDGFGGGGAAWTSYNTVNRRSGNGGDGSLKIRIAA